MDASTRAGEIDGEEGRLRVEPEAGSGRPDGSSAASLVWTPASLLDSPGRRGRGLGFTFGGSGVVNDDCERAGDMGVIVDPEAPSPVVSSGESSSPTKVTESSPNSTSSCRGRAWLQYGGRSQLGTSEGGGNKSRQWRLHLGSGYYNHGRRILDPDSPL